jgi:hypothetical protein
MRAAPTSRCSPNRSLASSRRTDPPIPGRLCSMPDSKPIQLACGSPKSHVWMTGSGLWVFSLRANSSRNACSNRAVTSGRRTMSASPTRNDTSGSALPSTSKGNHMLLSSADVAASRSTSPGSVTSRLPPTVSPDGPPGTRPSIRAGHRSPNFAASASRLSPRTTSARPRWAPASCRSRRSGVGAVRKARGRWTRSSRRSDGASDTTATHSSPGPPE